MSSKVTTRSDPFKMKLVNFNVTYQTNKKTNKREETKTRKPVVFSPTGRTSSTSQTNSKILSPMLPPLDVVNDVILCSPCDFLAPSFQNQDSKFTLNLRSRNPAAIKSKDKCCSEMIVSKNRLSFLDRISALSSTIN